MTAIPNVWPQVELICQELDLEPSLCRRFTITHDEVEAELYLTNEQGKKYIDPETEHIATETQTFKIQTYPDHEDAA